MRNGKILLATVWVAAITVVVILGATLKQEAGHFFGITDNREHAVSFPHPVEIVQALVVEGQEVEAGTLMLRLSRPDLQAEIAVVQHQIAELGAKHRETAVTLEGQINALEQDQKVHTAALDTEIAELRKRHSLNLDLLRSISGDGAGAADSHQSSPLLAKLAGLQRERQQVTEAVRSKTAALRQRIDATDAPDQARTAELNTHLAELSRQQESLSVNAKSPGRVGSVLYRPGDQVPAFQPIITFHSLAPELVKGYIHEDVYNAVSVGQQVWLRSLANAHLEPMQGTVEGLGARIIPYPDRLLKNAGLTAWGREVVVRLEQHNPLLLGERVIVDLDKPVTLEQRISASFREVVQQGAQIADAFMDLTRHAVDGTLDGIVPTALASTVAPDAELSSVTKP